MKIFTAYICYSCEEVLDGAPRGRCQVCSSDAVYPLAWLARPEEERSKWFKLINGKKEGLASPSGSFPVTSLGS